ncbi:DUF7344 domain-containing protein [Haladaptatus sp. NG-SE-30]
MNLERTYGVDEAYSLLSDPRRRYIMYYLTREEDSVSPSELAKQIVAWETDVPVSEVPEDDTDAVLTSINHVHLPKLADAGIITYKPNPGNVELDGEIEAMTPYLEYAASIEFDG